MKQCLQTLLLTMLLLLGQSFDLLIIVKAQRTSKAKISQRGRSKPKSGVAKSDNNDNSNRTAAKKVLADEERRTGWKVTTGNDVFLIWYNTKSIVDLGNSKVRVWIKQSLYGNYKDNPLEARKKLKLQTEGYENYAYSIELHEYNCRLREFHILSFTDYDRTNQVIDSVESNDDTWSYVAPNSISERLLNTICKLKL